MASVDQVLGRRESLRGLVLLGIRRSTLQRAQLYESLIPLLVVVPAAIGLGHATGSAYLDIVGGPSARWLDVIPVLSVGTAGALAASVILLVLAVPRIDAATIRRP